MHTITCFVRTSCTASLKHFLEIYCRLIREAIAKYCQCVIIFVINFRQLEMKSGRGNTFILRGRRSVGRPRSEFIMFGKDWSCEEDLKLPNFASQVSVFLSWKLYLSESLTSTCSTSRQSPFKGVKAWPAAHHRAATPLFSFPCYAKGRCKNFHWLKIPLAAVFHRFVVMTPLSWIIRKYWEILNNFYY